MSYFYSLLIARCIAVAESHLNNQDNNCRVTGMTNCHDQLHQTHLIYPTLKSVKGRLGHLLMSV